MKYTIKRIGGLCEGSDTLSNYVRFFSFQNTKQFSKHKISFQNKKSVFKTKNQFSKHKSSSQTTNHHSNTQNQSSNRKYNQLQISKTSFLSVMSSLFNASLQFNICRRVLK